MKDSFIGKKEINDFLEKLDDNKDSSLFRIGDQDSKNLTKTNESDILESDKLYKETSYRFVVLILFCVLSFSNGMQWVTFAPIASKFKKVYNLRTYHVDLFSLIYMMAYPFVNFPSSYIIDNKSMRLGIIISAILTALGAVCKVFINSNILFAYFGQTLAAIAQPFIVNSPGKIASTWFRDERRVLATSVCCLANTFGIVFGYTLPAQILDDTMGSEEFKSKMVTYLTTEAIISVVICLFVVLFMRSKPKIPPSKSQNHYQSPPIWDCLKLMIKNKNFIKLLISFTCVLSYLNVYGTILNEYFNKYGLNEDQTSLILGVANVTGIVGSIIISIIIDKYKNYKSVLSLLNIVGLISHISMTVLIEVYEEHSFVISLFLWTLCSTAIIPIFTCSMDFVVELTYPVGESISGGFIMVVNQFIGVFLILLCDYFMDSLPQYRYLPNVFCASFFIISFFGIFSMEEKLIRHEKDMEK